MFERLRRVLVESYVGAIALGYLLAQDVLHFVGVFSAPVTVWATRKDLGELMASAHPGSGFPFRDSMAQLSSFLLLLLLWYVLMRWLYFKPISVGSPAEPPAQQATR